LWHYAVQTTSVPSGAKSVYQDVSNNTAVAVIPYGRGEIVFVAFDWYNAVPVGTQDNGWLGILGNAVVEVTTSSSGLVYRTDLDAGLASFEVYNTNTNAWTSLNPIDNAGQLGVGPDGTLFMVNRATGFLQAYSPASDTWSNIMATPFAGRSFGTLEVTNSGKFYYWTMQYGGIETDRLYYTTGVCRSGPSGRSGSPSRRCATSNRYRAAAGDSGSNRVSGFGTVSGLVRRPG
jgi:hypothetical protein